MELILRWRVWKSRGETPDETAFRALTHIFFSVHVRYYGAKIYGKKAEFQTVILSPSRIMTGRDHLWTIWNYSEYQLPYFRFPNPVVRVQIPFHIA
jgi:hypothetical protein